MNQAWSAWSVVVDEIGRLCIYSVTTGSPGDGKALRGQQTWAQPLGWPLSHQVYWDVSEFYRGVIFVILAKGK